MRRLLVLLLMVGLAVVPASGGADEADRGGQASWNGLLVPFVRTGTEPIRRLDRIAVRFRGTELPYSRLPDGVVSIAATADSAVVSVRNYRREEFNGSLVEISADGTTGTVDTHALGIPMADPLGHHAFWTSARRSRARLVAYDTRTHTRVLGPFVDRNTRVFAVDGDEAFLAASTNNDPGASSWTVEEAVLQPLSLPSSDDDGTALIGDVAGDLVLSTDYDRTVLSDRQAVVQRVLPTRSWGTFSPDARFIASGGLEGRVRVWSVDQGSEVELRGMGRWRPVYYSWSPTGSLVVSAELKGLSYDDANPARRFVCRLPSGRCDRLPGRSALFLEPQLPSSAFGQLVTVY